MEVIKKKLSALFLWSWLLTFPFTLLGSYLTYRALDHFQTFVVRYNPQPAEIVLSNELLYQVKTFKSKIKAAIRRFEQNETQLEAIYLFASQTDLSRLDENLPHSGFNYIKAGILQGKGYIKAKIRYRGDFYPHWGLEKKSIRVKTSKKQLYQGMRTFNLIAPKFLEQLNNYLAYRLSSLLGLITPQTKLVRVFMNNEDRGVHVLVEQLKEMTLRRHKRMPADVYRGEMVGRDQYTDAQINDLFQSESVWDKVAVNNHYSGNSKKPLAYLLQLIKDQDNPQAQAELSRLLDIKAWARFSMYEALIQSWHFDKLHNWRIYYDPWRQKFEPIVWDPVGWRWLLKRGAINEINITEFHKALFKNGDFLRQRYQLMQDFYTSGQANEFLGLVKETRQIMGYEVFSDPALNSPDAKKVRGFINSMEQAIHRVFTALKKDYLAPSKAVLYQFQLGQLQLYLQDQRPLKRLRLDFSKKINTQSKVLIHYQQQQQQNASHDITNKVSYNNYQLIIDLDLLPNFSSKTQNFKFYKGDMDKPLLGDYRINIEELDTTPLLQLWADYGQGWVKAQEVLDKEIFTKGLSYMQELIAKIPNQEHSKPWQIFYGSGQGFNEDNSVIVRGAQDKEGLWKYSGLFHSGITELRVDLPENSALHISDLIIKIENKSHTIPVHSLKLHDMEIKDKAVVSAGMPDSFFNIDMKPLLEKSEKNKVIQAELSFKVGLNLPWKKILEQNLFPFHSDIYSVLPKEKFSAPLIWSGEINIKGVQTISRPLVIQAGTRIMFTENASLIIKNRLLAMGSKEKPIRFLAETKGQKPWGAVVLFGPQANDSILSHCLFSEGSGLKGDLFEYTAMLSIHDVQGVYISDCEFRDNQRVDDMVHAVYSELRFERNVFKNAHADALDIDISKAVIIANEFIGSGNDAIDLMTSQAVVVDSLLENNADKAISVGEDSHLFALNNQMIANEIAIQAKDRSTAILFNQTLSDNQTALHAYKKNWRYGSGGMIMAAKSQFIGNKIDLQAKKNSNIYLFDNFLHPGHASKRIKSWNNDNKNQQIASQINLPNELNSIPEVKQAIDLIAPEWLEKINNKKRGVSIAAN